MIHTAVRVILICWTVLLSQQSAMASEKRKSATCKEDENTSCCKDDENESCDNEKRKDFGTITFQFENDLFWESDRHYTNGMRLSYLLPREVEFDWLDWLIAQDEESADCLEEVRYGLALGQDMYTPERDDIAELIEDDRPYAGWLYGAATLHIVSKPKNDDHWYKSKLESIELNLGVVGPWAQGEEAQDFVHEIRLMETFQGWDNQLENEPGFLLQYERKWWIHDAPPIVDPLQVDFVPHVGGSLGNVLTHGNSGSYRCCTSFVNLRSSYLG